MFIENLKFNYSRKKAGVKVDFKEITTKPLAFQFLNWFLTEVVVCLLLKSYG